MVQEALPAFLKEKEAYSNGKALMIIDRKAVSLEEDLPLKSLRKVKRSSRMARENGMRARVKTTRLLLATVARKSSKKGPGHRSRGPLSAHNPLRAWPLSELRRRGSWRHCLLAMIYSPLPGTAVTRPLSSIWQKWRGETRRTATTLAIKTAFSAPINQVEKPFSLLPLPRSRDETENNHETEADPPFTAFSSSRDRQTSPTTGQNPRSRTQLNCKPKQRSVKYRPRSASCLRRMSCALAEGGNLRKPEPKPSLSQEVRRHPRRLRPKMISFPLLMVSPLRLRHRTMLSPMCQPPTSLHRRHPDPSRGKPTCRLAFPTLH